MLISASHLRPYGGDGLGIRRLWAEPIPRARAVRVGDRLRWFIAVESLRATLRRKFLAPGSVWR